MIAQPNENEHAPVASGLQNSFAQWLTSRSLPRAPKAQGGSGPRISVVITRRSIRLLDQDNLWGGVKPLVDQLRAITLIPEDNPTAIKLDVRQLQVAKKTDEGTEVQVIHHD